MLPGRVPAAAQVNVWLIFFQVYSYINSIDYLAFLVFITTLKLLHLVASLLCAVCRCVKFLESNETSQLIFASLTIITAKDAAPLDVSF